MEGATYVIEGYEFFKTNNDGDLFVVPDEFPQQWNEISQMCDRKNGKLIWRNNLKTCIPK